MVLVLLLLLLGVICLFGAPGTAGVWMFLAFALGAVLLLLILTRKL